MEPDSPQQLELFSISLYDWISLRGTRYYLEANLFAQSGIFVKLTISSFGMAVIHIYIMVKGILLKLKRDSEKEISNFNSLLAESRGEAWGYRFWTG